MSTRPSSSNEISPDDFRQASTAELPRLPAGFAPVNRVWHTLPLRDDVVLERTVDKVFARLREEGGAETASLQRQIKIWKAIAALVAIGFFIAAIWLLYAMLSTATAR